MAHSNCAQTVRVRYNGAVVTIAALTIDDSLCGGEEIYRFIHHNFLLLHTCNIIPRMYKGSHLFPSHSAWCMHVRRGLYRGYICRGKWCMLTRSLSLSLSHTHTLTLTYTYTRIHPPLTHTHTPTHTHKAAAASTRSHAVARGCRNIIRISE